jgi:hypothetical protein
MTEKQRIIVGLAWYRAEDWEEIRRISMDADRLDETHDAWMRSAEVQREQMRRAGYYVHKIIIDPKKKGGVVPEEGEGVERGEPRAVRGGAGAPDGAAPRGVGVMRQRQRRTRLPGAGAGSDRGSIRVPAAMVALILVALLAPGSSNALANADGVQIHDDAYQGRSHFRIETATATYWYDKAGGGLSRVIDREGRDWVAFKKEPLNAYPAAAAAGFRGMPNCVFRSEDGGAGHPGFDRCESEKLDARTIRSVSKSGKWAWRWEFFDTHARMTMEKVDPEHAWWFLYEGPVAGTFEPGRKYWATDTGGPRRERPDHLKGEAAYEKCRWAYFGDERVGRVLFVAQHEADDLVDAFSYLGNTEAGIRSTDGMVVFGFGRGAGAKPLMRESGVRFNIGFVEAKVETAADHRRVARVIEAMLSGP